MFYNYSEKCVVKCGFNVFRRSRFGHFKVVCLCVSGVQKTEEEKIVGEMVNLVRNTIGPVAAFRKVLFVGGLPKTRSGKIPRSSLANLVNGKPYKVQHNPQPSGKCLVRY